MKILIDVLHPAHVHFFRNAVAELRRAGHEVLLTARDKDITRRLLEELGLRHTVLSAEADGLGGRARELLARNAKLLELVRGERPDVMASIAGVSTSPVGFLTRTPSYVFYDTENAKQGDLGSQVLPRNPTGVVWTAGEIVETKWNVRANHGGGCESPVA